MNLFCPEVPGTDGDQVIQRRIYQSRVKRRARQSTALGAGQCIAAAVLPPTAWKSPIWSHRKDSPDPPLARAGLLEGIMPVSGDLPSNGARSVQAQARTSPEKHL
jgi:hypothetical protein